MTREQIIEQMTERQANAKNVFTGKQLKGKDLKDWELLERQRAYSLDTK